MLPPDAVNSLSGRIETDTVAAEEEEIRNPSKAVSTVLMEPVMVKELDPEFATSHPAEQEALSVPDVVVAIAITLDHPIEVESVIV